MTVFAVVLVFIMTAESPAYLSWSCAELAAAQVTTEAGDARLAEWMERHCPGALENMEPFCSLQSHWLLERLASLAEVKSALRAKGCDGR